MKLLLGYGMDEKKPPGFAGGFSCVRVLRVLSTLSIRLRSEMPEKIKVKLRGEHGGVRFSGAVFEKGDCLYNPIVCGLASGFR
ncbi:hypothetical protein [Paraburkholderia caballeronis]|uniref:hypothetical protein n=1 Tax=Paraburkholderia caballeronis TaxID=416943 RepID=UPI0014312AEA|nr:hypothetical protein [Paraburkholderia caballeronis]